eukprot:gene17650-33429_t
MDPATSGSLMGARDFCSPGTDQLSVVREVLASVGNARVAFARVLTWATLSELAANRDALDFAVSANRDGGRPRLQSMLHPGKRMVSTDCASSTPTAHKDDNPWARGGDNVKEWVRASTAFAIRKEITYTKDTISLLVALADYCTAELCVLGVATGTVVIELSTDQIVSLCEQVEGVLTGSKTPTEAKVAVRAATRPLPANDGTPPATPTPVADTTEADAGSLRRSVRAKAQPGNGNAGGAAAATTPPKQKKQKTKKKKKKKKKKVAATTPATAEPGSKETDVVGSSLMIACVVMATALCPAGIASHSAVWSGMKMHEVAVLPINAQGFFDELLGLQDSPNRKEIFEEGSKRWMDPYTDLGPFAPIVGAVMTSFNTWIPSAAGCGYQISEMVRITSEDSPAQPLHIDFRPASIFAAIVAHGLLLYSVLVFGAGGGKLCTPDGDIDVDPYGILFFPAHLIHGGAYYGFNVRFFAYIVPSMRFVQSPWTFQTATVGLDQSSYLPEVASERELWLEMLALLTAVHYSTVRHVAAGNEEARTAAGDYVAKFQGGALVAFLRKRIVDSAIPFYWQDGDLGDEAFNVDYTDGI